MSLRIGSPQSIGAWLVGLFGVGLLATGPVAEHCRTQADRAASEWRLTEAASSTQWALRLRPYSDEARVGAASALQRVGNFRLSDRTLGDPALIDEPDARALAYHLAAVNRFHFAQPAEALRLHTTSQDSYRELRDLKGELSATIAHARTLYHGLGRHAQALELLENVLKRARDADLRALEATTLRHLGALRWWFLDDHTALGNFYQPALSLYEELDHRAGVAAMLSNISLVHRSNGDMNSFLDLQTRSLALYQETGDLFGESESQRHLGQFYSSVGNFREGREWLRRSLALTKRTGDRLGEEEILFSLAYVLGQLGDPAAAIRTVLPTLEREGAANSVAHKYRQSGLAPWHMELGDYDAAQRAVVKARSTQPENGDVDVSFETASLVTLAEIALARGRIQEAASLVEQAEAFASDVDSYRSLIGLRRVQAELAEQHGDRDRAIVLLQEGSRIERATVDRSPSAIGNLSDSRVDDRLLELLLLEDGANRLDESTFDLSTQRLASVFEHIETVGRKQARNAIRRLLPSRRTRSEDRFPMENSETERRLSVVQGGLGPHTALVYYLSLGEDLLAFAITADKAGVVLLPVQKRQLETKVRLARELIEDASNGTDWRPVLRDLQTRLIAPLERRGFLGGIRKLAIVPTGPLYDLPFAALVTEHAGKMRHLVEDFALFSPPSASFLEEPAGSNDHANSGALAFGIGAGWPKPLPSLINAEAEASAVVAALGGSALLDKNGTESAFKQRAPNYRWIHLATHAVMEPRLPLLSTVALVEGGGEDGALTVREILDSRLTADLITLGACRSGRGFSAGGSPSGFDRLGLVEAFLYAGARSVLASQIDARDSSAIQLMTSFYRSLAASSSNPTTGDRAHALAVAQRQMILGPSQPHSEATPNFQHPAHWAGFVLVGSDR